MENPTYIVGCGGFAKEVFYYACENGINITGFIDNREGGTFLNLPVVSDDDIININYDVNVIIGIGNSIVRKKIVERYSKNKHIIFPKIVSKSAVICGEVKIDRGSIVCASTTITTDINIGEFCIINIGTTIGHDTVIGNYSTINPGCNISGNVTVGECCEIGTGTQIIQRKSIVENTTIGAGAVIVSDIRKANCLVVGVPGRIVKQNND